MRTLPIARSLRLALIGLTVVLAVIAALGVASLYGARQSHDDTLHASSSVSTLDLLRLIDRVGEQPR